MVAAPLILGGDLKISDQNNWGDLSKKLNLGGAKFKGGPMNIVGKGGHTLPPISKIPPLSRNPRCPHLSQVSKSGKQKY